MAKPKRKSKNSKFFANARGFAKKGNFGRGTHIEEDEFNYFINICDIVRKGFESIEEKETMANNVIVQTVGKEVHLSSNQVVSKAIEALIGFTNVENFERFLEAFAENLRPICSDKFASHIIQKIVEICFLRTGYYKKHLEDKEGEPTQKKKKQDEASEEAFNTSQQFPESHRKNCSDFLMKISKFMLNNLEDFIWDAYATFIIRTCVISLAGIYEKKTSFVRKNQDVKHEKVADVPKEWEEIIREFIVRLEMWPQFSDLAYNTFSAQLLAHLVIALKVVDKNLLKHIGKKILTESFLKVEDCDEKKKDVEDLSETKEKPESSNSMPMVFRDSASLRLLETLLTIAGPKLFTQLNAMLFTGRIKELSLNRMANFAVQKLIENVKEKDEFESIFDEVESSLEELLKAGHTGVVLALANTCLRLLTKQGAFVSALLNALHISGSKEKFSEMITCILKLKPYEVAVEDKSNFIHLHGSLILQHMLEYNKPIKLVQCILEMPADNLALIFSNANGSFVANAFMNSKSIGEKSREKIIKHLEGNYITMANTQFGSRVVEVLFNAANDVQQSKIAKELAERMNQLNSTLFGRLLVSKLRLATYQLSATQWKASFNKAKKAEVLFKDIVK